MAYGGEISKQRPSGPIIRLDVMPSDICCSRCGGRFTRECPARPWWWSYGQYWPVHRQCPRL